MKSNRKTIIIILLILVIIFVFSPIFTNNLSFSGSDCDISNYDDEFNHDDLNISSSSGKIHINNNWTAAKVAGICTGKGTYSEPYIIEDLVIDGGGSGSCILIQNSNVFFRIENCSVYNSGNKWSNSPSDDAGIKFLSVTNSQLIDNNCTSNNIGIKLYSSDRNTISGNTANNNIKYGMHINQGSSNNVVSGNTLNNNEKGIYISSWCYNNIVSRNTANYNTRHGIHLYWQCKNNIISENTANYNGDGIHLYQVYNNIVSGNTVNFNTWYGICLYQVYNCSISENTLNNNECGIYLSYAMVNSILANDVTYNNYGIYLFGYNEYTCLNNTITENFINYNILMGIYLEGSHENDIYLNCFNNSLNAVDNSSNNEWDNGIKGNYWADYTGSDENDNGIGDVPYYITGSAGSKDNFPLMKCPLPRKEIGKIPNILIFLISVIGGGAVIGLATFFDRRKRKRIE